MALLKASGAGPNWQLARAERYEDIQVLTVPLKGRTGSMLVSFKDDRVLDVTMTVLNSQGIATYLDLRNRFGLRLEVSSKALLASGTLPELTLQSLTPIDEIEFQPEEELAPLGYYDPTGCVPDALYERLINAAQAVQSARRAYQAAAAAEAALMATVAASCSTPVTTPGCIAAATGLAAAHFATLAARANLNDAEAEYERVHALIKERINQCRGG